MQKSKMTKVTSGPWKVTEDPNDGCCWTHHVETVERSSIPGAEHTSLMAIADVSGEANARLIAAAPDLLAALNILGSADTPYEHLCWCSRAQKRLGGHSMGCRAAAAAIAKATTEKAILKS